MTNPAIIGIVLSIALILFLGGLFFNKTAYYISIFGALIMVIFGIYMLGSPIEIQTGSSVFFNSTTNMDMITYTYETIDTNISYLVSFVICLLGLAGVLVGYNRIQDSNEKEKNKHIKSFDD